MNLGFQTLKVNIQPADFKGWLGTEITLAHDIFNKIRKTGAGDQSSVLVLFGQLEKWTSVLQQSGQQAGPDSVSRLRPGRWPQLLAPIRSRKPPCICRAGAYGRGRRQRNSRKYEEHANRSYATLPAKAIHNRESRHLISRDINDRQLRF